MDAATIRETRDRLVMALLRDAELQEAGWDAALGSAFDELDSRAVGSLPTIRLLREAIRFWDCWLDSRDHGWGALHGVPREEWPTLARDVAAALSRDEPIASARLRSLLDR